MSLLRLASFGALGLGLVAGLGPAAVPPSVVRPNPNTTHAGVLRNGVLSVTLEARSALYQLDRAGRPLMSIEAFAEPGKQPLMPGPLVRAPAGTEIRLSVRNTLRHPLTFFVPAVVHGGGSASGDDDSLIVAPGGVETLTIRAARPGNYSYRATVPNKASEQVGMAGVLGGAIVVDSADARTRVHDQVFVIMATPDSALVAYADSSRLAITNAALPPGHGEFIYTINGRSWPTTDRIQATVGDSLHWRIINASTAPHPMHLHGFYFRVDDYFSPLAGRFGRPAPGQMAVTQLMAPFSTMSMTWSPDRPGNWLFHCHFALHNTPQALISMHEPQMSSMVGLVLGIEVAARPGVAVAGEPAPTRRLRLIASTPPSGREPDKDSVPPMHFVLDEHGHQSDAGADFSPELDLVRGEPVAITIVNHLSVPTTVHWHGIELDDSYMDGVPDFSGARDHLTPAIAPGDSFVARFTPPRAGTFMYHAHVNDAAEELGGLEGALIVRDRKANAPGDDHVLFFKGLLNDSAHPTEINGEPNPDTLVLRVGHTARLRLINLSTVNIAPLMQLTARPDSAVMIAHDTMLVRWRPVAKDGFDLPPAQQTLQPSRQIVAVGETYDFEFAPAVRGNLRLELRTNAGNHRLLIRVPIRVE